MKKIAYIFLVILSFLINITGCKKDSVPVFSQAYFEFNEAFNVPEQQDVNIEGFPAAGILSHHLLSAVLIDSWFRKLSELRDIEVFFILSPAHYDTSVETFSLTYGDWQVENGIIHSNKKIVADLLDSFNVKPEPYAFYNEHGVLSFIWFIKKYFPKAEIVAITCRGEPPVNTNMAEKLKDTLLPYFDNKNRNRNFLLISSDFAHHNDLENTLFKDNRTEKFLENPCMDTWIFAGCDNRPGIYVLAGLAENLKNPRMHIMYHSNSWEISGQGEDDITSYFFTFLTETVP